MYRACCDGLTLWLPRSVEDTPVGEERSWAVIFAFAGPRETSKPSTSSLSDSR